MPKTIIIALPPMGKKLAGTLLSRKIFDTSYYAEAQPTLQNLLNSPPGLLIVHVREGGREVHFLETLHQAYPSCPFPVVAISETPGVIQLPPIVKLEVAESFEPEKFSRLLARLLELPMRRNTRFLVRLGISVAKTPGTVLATTIDVSTTGMLLETSHELQLGWTYELEFMGNQNEDIPTLNILIIREEFPASKNKANRRYAVSFEDRDENSMKGIIQQLIPGIHPSEI